jgi:hypothetical protein
VAEIIGAALFTLFTTSVVARIQDYTAIDRDIYIPDSISSSSSSGFPAVTIARYALYGAGFLWMVIAAPNF